MRIAILSDTHSNLAALEAVINHAEANTALDQVWCLGDTVGYGPQPHECLTRLQSIGTLMVSGNHDLAAVGKIHASKFNSHARASVEWTANQLTKEDCLYVNSLPAVIQVKNFTLVHGTLRSPAWDYLTTHETANAHLKLQQSQFSLVGHTHVPMVVIEEEHLEGNCDMRYLTSESSIDLANDQRIIINPGSVGQPRDNDCRASYAIYDTTKQRITLHRVDYDIATTQALMELAQIPTWLIERLAIGR